VNLGFFVRLLAALILSTSQLAAQPLPQMQSPDRAPPIAGAVQPGPNAQRLVAVPSLIGATGPEAERRLAAVRLALQVQGTPPRPDSKIASQSPQAGQLVPAGTRIVVVFALEPAPGLVVVPSIIGMDAALANRQLVGAGLALQADPNSPASPGAKVIRQNPQPGQRVARGTWVIATFETQQPRLVLVPSIIGADAREAGRRLQTVGLILQPDQRAPLAPDATATRQNPQPGARVPLGTRIIATFSVPPVALVSVPSILGDDAGEAGRRLAAAQLVLQPEQQTPVTPDARVIRQNPEAGQRVRAGTRVLAAFEIPPPQLVPVPSIIGDDAGEAGRRLAAAQLVLQPEQQTPVTPDARVIRQNPEAGQRVRAGTRVLAAFEVPPPQLVPVPSIIGITLAEAQRRLATAGLVLQPDRQSPATADLRIVGQDPQAGTRVPPGTQVQASLEVPPPLLVSVPSIVGADQAEAQRQLVAAQLALQSQPSPPAAGAKVARQSPDAGQKVPPGTAVVAVFEVPAPQPITVPSVIGTDLADARRRLTAADLRLLLEEGKPAAPGAKIVRQEPVPGQLVAPGSQVVVSLAADAARSDLLLWLGGTLALLTLALLLKVWRRAGRLRQSRPDVAAQAVVHVHPRKDPGRPVTQSNGELAGPAFGLRVRRPPPVITVTEHDEPRNVA
jgi:beta-lactam-binding protein with PASTA domain